MRLFALTSQPETVRAYFGYRARPDFPPRAEIAPTEPIAIVCARAFTRGEDRRFLLVRWGFLPGFVKDPETFPLIVNARAESVLDRPSFVAAFKRRRCLAPADGFYAGSRPRRYLTAADGAPFGLAGLYETYIDANGGEIDGACVLTTSADPTLAALAKRMPVIVPRSAFSAWLDEATPLDDTLALLRPAPEGLLQSTPAALR
jgi:putative SOS response-associated peptidase YedK